MRIGITSWWRRFVKHEQVERQLDTELRFHFDSVVAENIRSGMSESEARRQARIEFGGLDQVKEECRDVRGTRWFTELAQDVRFGIRTFGKSKGVTAIIVATLALGIGVNTAIFTVVNAVLLEPLPYPHPERIIQLGRTFADRNAEYANSIPKFVAWRDNDVFEAMAIYDGGVVVTLGSEGPPVSARAVHVSADFFKVFGVTPAQGRAFSASEDIPKGPPVAVISHALLQTRFGGRSQAIGGTILLNGSPYTIVGVLPSSFHADPEADVWLPIQVDPNTSNQGHGLFVAARLKADATLPAAQSQMKIAGERFRAANPKWMVKGEGVAVVTMRDAKVGDVRPALLILMGAVGLVLLIACANIANLLLARAAARQREIAIRAALGANRGRVVRQLVTESVLLAGFGGVLGFTLGALGVRALLAFAPGSIPRLTDPLTDPSGTHPILPALDWRVGLFAIATAAVTAILFGLFPALKVSKPDLSSMLKEAAGRSATGWKHNRARATLVVSEVALALLLLTGAVLLIRSFAGLRSFDVGFDARQMFTMQTGLAAPEYSSTANVAHFSTEALRRIASIPGVEAAASANMFPLQGGLDMPFAIAGRLPVDGDYSGDQQWRSVSPGYFRAFRIPLMRGRVFTDNDVSNSGKVVLINEAMAQKYWPNQDPIGQVITIGHGLGPQYEDPPRQIVGIVGNVREGLEFQTRALNMGVMYIPLAQVPDGITALENTMMPMAWAVRTRGEPMALRDVIERELRAAGARVPISRERTMEQIIGGTFAHEEFNTLLLTLFAAIALLLASIGVYGLMAYSVEQRTQEIGVRVALGASLNHVRNMIVSQGVRLVLAGVALGVAAAYGLTRLLASLLFGVQPHDPVTFLVVPGVLIAVALAACWLPARRATQINPAEALRYE